MYWQRSFRVNKGHTISAHTCKPCALFQIGCGYVEGAARS